MRVLKVEEVQTADVVRQWRTDHVAGIVDRESVERVRRIGVGEIDACDVHLIFGSAAGIGTARDMRVGVKRDGLVVRRRAGSCGIRYEPIRDDLVITGGDERKLRTLKVRFGAVIVRRRIDAVIEICANGQRRRACVLNLLIGLFVNRAAIFLPCDGRHGAALDDGLPGAGRPGGRLSAAARSTIST